MKNTISKAAYTGLGHCSVCGQWTKLEMWDDGLRENPVSNGEDNNPMRISKNV
jgi:hypothetical protein